MHVNMDSGHIQSPNNAKMWMNVVGKDGDVHINASIPLADINAPVIQVSFFTEIKSPAMMSMSVIDLMLVKTTSIVSIRKEHLFVYRKNVRNIIN